jgi:hypothetical protein
MNRAGPVPPPRAIPRRPARLDPLDRRDRIDFLTLALPAAALRRVCREAGLTFPGYRLEAVPAAPLARAVAEEYEADRRLASAVDAILERHTAAVPAPPARLAAADVDRLVLLAATHPDQAVMPLIYRLLGHRTTGVREAAARALRGYTAALDAMVADAVTGDEAVADGGGGSGGAGRSDLRRRLREAEARNRGLARDLEAVRQQLEEERRLAASRDARVAEARRAREALERRLREAEEARRVLEASRPHDLVKELRSSRAEAARLEREARDLHGALEDSRRKEAALVTEVKRLGAPPLPPAPSPAEGGAGRPGPAQGPFHVPVLTPEFYASIDRCDPRVVRTAFEKILLLAQDLHHPGLDARPLQGAGGLYRIFVAQDVRLMYRRLPGGRLEILSLIDREDLDRYLRQYKTRPDA